MREHDISGDYVALQGYYTEKLIGHVTKLGLSAIVWEDVFTTGVPLPSTAVVHVWRPEPREIIAQVRF